MKFSLPIIVSILAATGFAEEEKRAPAPMTFYSETQGTGASVKVNVILNSCRRMPAGWNNRASSVYKPRGYRCTFYDGPNCGASSQSMAANRELYCSFGSLNKKVGSYLCK
ncbi:hypothetical protein VFPPC_13496 [Pochonia chlamydosporia 170]|uniref:Uncharacterized protein n=1 Tax=Pochonia chlamydosporia 170 TaxID=1380566 RepID=A0A179G1P5_METCM|nr:hypothetical protein VFPPC_13496 [Pochonia chlamydosporia 170]OAQ71293.1 hypothetical protein VFPPC_13496 [Pochonia chlamydosporia 170]